MAKWVYMFTEGNANMRNLLGGKGEMCIRDRSIQRPDCQKSQSTGRQTGRISFFSI